MRFFLHFIVIRYRSILLISSRINLSEKQRRLYPSLIFLSWVAIYKAMFSTCLAVVSSWCRGKSDKVFSAPGSSLRYEAILFVGRLHQALKSKSYDPPLGNMEMYATEERRLILVYGEKYEWSSTARKSIIEAWPKLYPRHGTNGLIFTYELSWHVQKWAWMNR